MDLLNNIYTRISGLAKSIKSLEESTVRLTDTIEKQTTSLNNTIKDLKSSNEKDSQYSQLILKQIGETAVGEIKMLQDNIGLTALTETTDRLKSIIKLSEEALNPEMVNVLFAEVLESIKKLSEQGESKPEGGSQRTMFDDLPSDAQPVQAAGQNQQQDADLPTPPGMSPFGMYGMMPPGGSPPGGSPPGGSPLGMTPPGGSPPGMTPPGGSPPGMTPPGGSPPGALPPGLTPPGGSPPGALPPGLTPPGGSPPVANPPGLNPPKKK